MLVVMVIPVIVVVIVVGVVVVIVHHVDVSIVPSVVPEASGGET